MIKKYLINNQEVEIDLSRMTNGSVTIRVDNTESTFEVVHKSDNELILQDKEHKNYKFDCFNNGNLLYKNVLYQISPFKQKKQGIKKANGLITPLPGKVISIEAKVGSIVQEGDTIVIIEAMKMEHRLCADKSGKLVTLNIKTGDNVPEGIIIGEIRGD